MTNLSAGLLAGVPLALVFGIYVALRGKALAVFFRQTNPQISRISQNALILMILACFAGMAFLFGAVSGLVFGWLGLPTFRYVAFGAAVFTSVLALVSKTPLQGDKIAWNLAVGGILGVLTPLLAS